MNKQHIITSANVRRPGGLYYMSLFVASFVLGDNLCFLFVKLVLLINSWCCCHTPLGKYKRPPLKREVPSEMNCSNGQRVLFPYLNVEAVPLLRPYMGIEGCRSRNCQQVKSCWKSSVRLDSPFAKEVRETPELANTRRSTAFRSLIMSVGK